MPKKIALLTASLVLFLVSIACQTLAGVPTPTVAQSGEVLFFDDFTDPESGWNSVTTETGESDYADGMYRILVSDTNTDIWSKPNLNYADSIIEVDAYKVGGSRDNRFGVLCRINGPDNFYSFIASSDGYYGIGKVKDSAYELLGTDALQPSEAIQVGSALNKIRVECVGDRLSLFVNGQLLTEVIDPEYTSGDVGLVAGTYQEPGTDIRFDNFAVLRP
jgi:hypothetical protein